jgi:hypothetical protein
MGAHFCLRAAIVLRRTDLQGAMRLFGEVANSYSGHDIEYAKDDSVAINVKSMPSIGKGCRRR